MKRHTIERLQKRGPFGRLRVLREGAGRETRSGRAVRTVVCLCECGVEKEIPLANLMKGATTSCGCYRRERLAEVMSERKRDYDTRSAEYRCWQQIRQRCSNPNRPEYVNYGGRGIRVCAEWEESFGAFFESVGRRPAKGYSIDRIDTNGDYEPGNCRWATRQEQSYNRRNARWLDVNGGRVRLCDAARRWGVPAAQILTRIRNGWCESCAATVESDPARGGGVAACPHRDVSWAKGRERERRRERGRKKARAKRLGADVRRRRERLGVSLRAMAERLGCSACFLSGLERGERLWSEAWEGDRGAGGPGGWP